MDTSFVANDRFDLSLLPAGPADAPGTGLEEKIISALKADGFLETSGSGPRSTWAWVVGLAACLAAVVALVALFASSDGPASQGVAPHNQNGAPKTVRLADRVAAHVWPAAQLTHEVDATGSVRVNQTEGKVAYRAESTPLTVQTPYGQVSVAGTCFLVDLDTQGPKAEMDGYPARIQVYEGRVRVETREGELELVRGQLGAIADTKKPPVAIATQDPMTATSCPIADSFVQVASGSSKQPGKTQSVSSLTLRREFALPNEVTLTGELVLEGQVLDPDGLPVAGAKVTLGTVPQKVALADASGIFSFSGMAPGLVRIHARKDDLVGGPASYHFDGQTQPMVIRTRRGSKVRLQVLDSASGEPVQGAWVESRFFEVRSALTDSEGWARFDGLHASTTELGIRASGYARHLEYVSVPESSPNPLVARVRLQPGSSISGTVVDSDSVPVAGARVLAMDTGHLYNIGAPLRDAVFTDAHGRFSFDSLKSATYRFSAEHPDHAPSMTDTFTHQASRKLEGVRIQLPPSTRLTGRIVDEQGVSVPFAQVFYSDAKGPVFGQRTRKMGGTIEYSQADGQGSFVLTGVPLKKLGVFAVHRGHHSKPLEVDASPGEPIDRIDIVMVTGGRIAGRVVNVSGEPVSEVPVAIGADLEKKTLQRAYLLRPFREVLTDGDGRFAFEGLVEGKYRIGTSWTPGRVMFTYRRPELVQTGDEDLELTLGKPGGLTGRVVYADGTSPKEFAVKVGYQRNYPFSGDDGRFTIERVSPGKLEVSVSSGSFPQTAPETITIASDEVTDLGDILVAAELAIRGRVLDPDGQPVVGASVASGAHVMSDGQNLIAENIRRNYPESVHLTQTDSQGRFEAIGVGPEGGVVIAEHEDIGRSAPVSLKPGDARDRIELTLVPFGSVEGRVTVNGKPASFAGVTVRRLGLHGHSAEARTDADGRYFLSRVAKGERIISVTPYMMHGRGDGRKITIRPGEKLIEDFDMKIGKAELKIELRPLPGADLFSAWVRLIPGEVRATNGAELRDAMRQVETNLHADYCEVGKECTISNILPGDYSLCATPLSGDLEDKIRWAKITAAINQLGVVCQPQHISSDEKPHTATMSLPGMDLSAIGE